MMHARFSGKVAVVTGAAGGIGRATAVAFAATGACVIVADVQTNGGNETVRRIIESGGDATFVRADVTKAGEVEALVAAAVDRYGRLDYAVKNAGIDSAPALLHECSEDNFDSVIAVNLKGVWLCMKFEVPQMIRQGGGAIVN